MGAARMAQGHICSRGLPQNARGFLHQLGDKLQIEGQPAFSNQQQPLQKPWIIQKRIGAGLRILTRGATDDLAHAPDRGQRLKNVELLRQIWRRQIAMHHLYHRPVPVRVDDGLNPFRLRQRIRGADLNVNRSGDPKGRGLCAKVRQ